MTIATLAEQLHRQNTMLESFLTLVQPVLAAHAVQASTSSAPVTPTTADTSAPSSQPLQVRMPLPTPDKYKGNSCKELATWLANVSSLITFNGWSLDSAQAISYASTFLTDRARQYWSDTVKRTQDVYANCRSWQQFAALLNSFLSDPHPAETARRDLRALRQTRSVRAYTDRYLQLACQIPGRPDEEFKSEYIAGLKDYVASWVKQAKPATFEAARHLAFEAEGANAHQQRPDPMELDTLVTRKVQAAVNRGLHNITASSSASTGRPRSPSPYPRSASFHRSSSGSKSPDRRIIPLNQLSEEERAELISSGKCLRCRKPGHHADRCPKFRHPQASKKVSWSDRHPKN